MRKNILVFDSGVGGLFIFRRLQEAFPNATLSYKHDPEGFPYGVRTDSFVVGRCLDLIPPACSEIKADLVVIACNTASTTPALPELRQKLAIPVVGVVPPVKPVAAHSKSKVIGILATEATVKRGYTTELIRQFAGDCEVITVGSPNLVQMAEVFVAKGTVDKEAIASEIKPFIDDLRVDAVAVACTHFSHFIPVFKELAGPRIQWIDSTEAIVERVRHLLSAS